MNHALQGVSVEVGIFFVGIENNAESNSVPGVGEYSQNLAPGISGYDPCWYSTSGCVNDHSDLPYSPYSFAKNLGLGYQYKGLRAHRNARLWFTLVTFLAQQHCMCCRFLKPRLRACW